MKVRAIVTPSVLAAATLVAAQQPPLTITQSDGNKLTYSADGVSFSLPNGQTKTLPSQWLTQHCPDLSKTGVTDPDSLAYLGEVCATWTKYKEQVRPQQQQSITEPPQTIPDNCSVMDVLAVSQNGRSDAYNLLGYEIAALAAGHQAEATNAVAVKSMKANGATDPVGMLADVFQKIALATDQYRCGAFLVSQYQGVGEDRQTYRTTAISVYNRLAIINETMKTYIEGRFRNVGVQSSPTDVVDNANTLAKLTNDRNAAFSDLVTAISLSGLLSYYTGDPSAKIVDTLNMSGAERQQLLTQLNEILKAGTTDEFTKDADLLKTLLLKHPKVRD